ncbi:MAG: hypothetical protein RR867_03325 [Ruthenibacterium sp.]
MRKQKLKALLCAICLLLCGCSTQPRLSERAIVKAIYLDQTGDIIEAALVVFTCDSGTDLSSVNGQARVYTGSGNSVDAAITAAEEKQNKKPFYAQNELLLIGNGAMQGKATSLLQYFTEEETLRQNLHVFYTPALCSEIVAYEPRMTEIVRVCEGMIHRLSGKTQFAQSVYALRENACGYLPVLKLQDSETMPVQADGLLLVQNGCAVASIDGIAMQLVPLLSEQTSTLTLRFTADDIDTTVVMQNLFLEKEIENNCLSLRLCGKAERCTQNGRTLQKDDGRHVIACANEQLERAFTALHEITFLHKNDVFNFAWWLRQQNNAEVEQALSDDAFYKPQRVRFQSSIHAA